MTGKNRAIALACMVFFGGAGVSSPAPAQERAEEVGQEAVAPESQHQANRNQVDIAHAIGSASEVEPPFGVVHLPTNWKVPLGHDAQGQPRYLDLSPTRHLVYILLAATRGAVIFLTSARIRTRQQGKGEPPKGFPGAMEAMTLWVRQEVVLPNVGAHGGGYAPYLLTVFFFILAMNLLGLLPWGATATSNIAVTAALALVSFLVIEITGMRALGFAGYMKTIFYLPPGLPGGVGGPLLKVLLLVGLTPIEIIGKVAEPFCLRVRSSVNT